MSHTAVAGRAWRSGAEAVTVCACAGAARENAAAAMIDASGRSDLAIIASPSAVNPVRGQRNSGFGLADAEQPVGDVASDRRAKFEPVAAAAADDTAILQLRMSVDTEMAVNRKRTRL